MNLEILTPVKSLSKPHRKYAPNEGEFDNFKAHLKSLINSIDETESEGYNENLIKTFLEDSFYKTTNQINKKDRQFSSSFKFINLLVVY